MKNPALRNPFVRYAALLCVAFALFVPCTRAAAAARRPSIYAFNVAAESTINLGATTSLNWSVGDADTLTLLPGIGDVTGRTSVDLSPTVTTTYVLTATNSAGSVSKSQKITVIVPPVIVSLTATPNAVTPGAAAKLTWSAPGATYYTITADQGNDPGQFFTTQTTVRPKVTTTYAITAHNTAGTDVKNITVAVISATPKPTIASFLATPESVVAGNAVTLSWSVNGASALSIAPDIGPVTGSNFTFKPATSATYTLTATNAGGSVTKSVPVTVTVPPPVIHSFAANPTTIIQGGSSTLSWSVDGATSLAISPSVGAVSGASVPVSPSANTTYTLSATNAGGTVTAQVNVAVTTPVPLPVIHAFGAQPDTITTGQSSTLNWSVEGADKLVVLASTGTSPGEVTGTTLPIKPAATTVYTLQASNATGTVTQTVQVTVNQPVPVPVIHAFAANPLSLSLGQTATLSWSVDGADSLSISADVGVSPGVVTGNSVPVSPSATTVYTLKATNASGTVTQAVKVSLLDPAPTIRSFAAIPNTIESGATATIIWDVVGAATLSIAADVGPSPAIASSASGSVMVTPLVTTSYTMTATSPGGVVSHSLTQILVQAAPPPPVPVIHAFSGSPSDITRGASTTLSWDITGADSITVSPGIGAVSGTSIPVSPTETTDYTISATNSYGTVNQTTTVTVSGPSAPKIVSFYATPAFIQNGGSSLLNWSVSGADSLSISADKGASPGNVSGTSAPVSPTETTSYTLSATNSLGTTTRTAIVTIYANGTGSVEHPRIWVTPASLSALVARAQAGDASWTRLRNDCDAYATMRVAFPDEPNGGNTIDGGYQYYDYMKPSFELSLGYLIARTVDPVRAARYAAKEKELLLALSDPVHHGFSLIDSGWAIRAYVPALAVGYDWIFETLGDSDRAQIYTEINRWVADYEAKGFGRSYPQGNYFAGYYCAKALGALATEGENPAAPQMWTEWLNNLHYGFVQPYHQQWLSGGSAPDGWGYGQLETLNMLRPLAAAFTAKHLDLIHDTAHPHDYPDGVAKWVTQFTWPDLKSVSDRGLLYDGDNPSAIDADWATQYAGFLRLANANNAAIAQRLALDLRTQQGVGGSEAWTDVLLFDATAPTAPYRTDLSYHTAGSGEVAMRSSWNSDAVWASFQSGPYVGYPGSAEEQFDQGGLVIQRGGVQFLINAWGQGLRNTPGTDDGDYPANTPTNLTPEERLAYHGKVFDGLFNEVYATSMDGLSSPRRLFNTYYAARASGYQGQLGQTPGSSTTMLTLFEEGGSYVLMRGGYLESQYTDDHPIDRWDRTVVYLRPQLFVVHDRTAINNANVDNWMAWHVLSAPAEQTGAPGTHCFDVVDKRPAFGGNLFRGRITTVLPAGHVAKTVNLFDWGKLYRVEVRPGTPVKTTTWVTVFDASSSAGTASVAAPLTAAAGNVSAGEVEGTIIAGADGTNTAVLFNKNGATTTGNISFTVPAAKTRCLVTGLQANTGYTVTVTQVGSNFILQILPGGDLQTTAKGTLSVSVSAAGQSSGQ